jgi:hypothetical protein
MIKDQGETTTRDEENSEKLKTKSEKYSLLLLTAPPPQSQCLVSHYLTGSRFLQR